jgi:hypothetical protein
MKDFTDWVNASLPVDRPDPVLLAMLKNHQAKACGASCPAGQSLASDGRCLPIAIVARASKQAPGAVQPAAGTKPAAIAEAPAVAASPPAQVSGHPEPLPGRMALAGPRDEEDLAGTTPPNQAAQPEQQDRKPAKKPRVRSAEPRYGPHNRRGMGAWIFHDAPVDRMLTW